LVFDMEERLKKLDYLFHPRSIAFIGATEMIAKWGFIIFNNILSGGYEGKLFPVNPGRKSILGVKAYPSVRDIPDEVDIAVFTVPARQVIGTVGDCVAKGVKAGVVISAGFKELGGEYEGMETDLMAKARAGGMLLVGPNCQGICCPSSKLFAWMPNFYPPTGKVGVISQSGNIQGMLIGAVVEPGFGISKGVSSGNEADLKMEDFYAYYAQDNDVEVIASYVEGLNDGRRFFEYARDAAKRKPVIVLKGGQTDSGVSAAKSHTGAMAVSNRIFDAACRQAGVMLADSIEEAGVIAASFLNRPIPRGKRVGILTGGGGLGVVAADVCAKEGLEVVKLSAETLEKIGKLMPDWWVPGNPVDMVAGLNFASITPVMEILMRSGEIDSLIVLFIGPPQLDRARQPASAKGLDMRKIWETMTKEFGNYSVRLFELMRELKVPLYLVSNFQKEIGLSDIAPGDDNMVIYNTIESACRAAAAIAKYGERRHYRN